MVIRRGRRYSAVAILGEGRVGIEDFAFPARIDNVAPPFPYICLYMQGVFDEQ
jgi:hypothetical protein